MELDYDALAREVHVHVLPVSQEEATRCDLWDLLDTEEQERWRHLLSAERQAEFLVAHGMLRVRLGQYLSVAPATLRFTHSAYGKPSLLEPAGVEMQFNLAHTRGRVLIAISRGRRLGVDIEYLNPCLPDPALYAELFTAREQHTLLTLPPELALRGFYTAWTRKEAFIKATGEGFSADLLAFSVSGDPRQPPQLMPPPGNAAWRLHHLEISPNVAAALVVAGPEDYTLRLWR
jgi:4'-phosphopantetheinyl transferase